MDFSTFFLNSCFFIRLDRKAIIEKHLSNVTLNLTSNDWEKILDATDGFSGADLSHLVNAVGMAPIREIHSRYWKLKSGMSLTQTHSICTYTNSLSYNCSPTILLHLKGLLNILMKERNFCYA